MFDNYTRAANDRCFDITDEDILRIWKIIENTSEDESAENWRIKITNLSYEYSLSSRFALMRIIYSRLNDCLPSEAETNEEFKIKTRKGTYVFPKLTMEYAKEIPKEELTVYEELLCEVASEQKDANRSADKYLIAKALKIEDSAVETALEMISSDVRKNSKEFRKIQSKIKKESKTILSREEAFKLGHILGFNFQEMVWFLLRVFDFEDGFRYNISNDLIEAYGFMTKSSWKKVSEIKQCYIDLSKNTIKAGINEKSTDWTEIVRTSLRKLVEKWIAEPELMDKKFLNWMKKQAPYLDLPSKTATTIYRSLANYIYNISIKKIDTPDISSYICKVEDICNGTYQFSEGKSQLMFDREYVSERKCKMISAEILEKNKVLYTSAPDRAKAWRTVSSNKNGMPKLIMAGCPDAGRSRVKDLLMGEYQVEKGDLLHLLWFGFNLCWNEFPISQDANSLFNNLADFIETAEIILDAALLPAFYPPHLMEQSMMLSIIVACADETGVPAFAYAELCESLIRARNR